LVLYVLQTNLPEYITKRRNFGETIKLLILPAEAKNSCRSISTIHSKTLAKVKKHENGGVVCEMSTDTAINRQPCALCLLEAK